jgi:hypothetical protein
VARRESHHHRAHSGERHQPAYAEPPVRRLASTREFDQCTSRATMAHVHTRPGDPGLCESRATQAFTHGIAEVEALERGDVSRGQLVAPRHLFRVLAPYRQRAIKVVEGPAGQRGRDPESDVADGSVLEREVPLALLPDLAPHQGRAQRHAPVLEELG